jgi:hypothetical protein
VNLDRALLHLHRRAVERARQAFRRGGRRWRSGGRRRRSRLDLEARMPTRSAGWSRSARRPVGEWLGHLFPRFGSGSALPVGRWRPPGTAGPIDRRRLVRRRSRSATRRMPPKTASRSGERTRPSRLAAAGRGS